MPSSCEFDRFQEILDEPDPARRAILARELFVEFETAAPGDDAAAALAVFDAIATDADVSVRHDFARFVAPSPALPAGLSSVIAADPDRSVAAPFLRLACVLADDILVDAAGSGTLWRQAAIAARDGVTAPVAAALAEVGERDAVLILLRNSGATVRPAALRRIAERFADDDTLAEAMLERRDVPGDLVEARIHTVSDRLRSFVGASGWLETEIAARAMDNAVEHSLVAFAIGRTAEELRPIMIKWRAERRITRGFVLRAAAYGALDALRLALGEVAGLPDRRCLSLWNDRSGYGRRSLISRAGFRGLETEFILQAAARFEAAPPCDRHALTGAIIAEMLRAEPAEEGFRDLLERFADDAGPVVGGTAAAQRAAA